MTAHTATIRDHVQVRVHPTVVQLADLGAEDAAWLSESFVLTQEIDKHLRALRQLFKGGHGCGVFVIGHYGSGKSHFLGYLTQQLRMRRVLSKPPEVVPLSLVNFSAANRLEDIVSGALGIAAAPGDRRSAWNELYTKRPDGVLLVMDELSEFLRSKADAHAFTEDIRFLQFLGEWCQDKRFWILAAMQEGIEHTGELEYSLYRKIKDRYPLRLLLTPAHVRTLIGEGILVKSSTYAQAVQRLVAELREVHPDAALDYQALQSIYPLHPATLELLEEVRDRFSQARGVVDFVVTRLRGDPTRGIEPFIDRPWGTLVTPELIVDHFRDLFELQPEFQGLAQQVFPWYRRHLDDLFDRPALRELAGRLLKLLVLVHLSPARNALTPGEAAAWMLFSATRVDPERNLKIVQRVLSQLCERGRYVAHQSGAYRLDLKDDGGALFEDQLQREIGELRGQDELILEALVPLLRKDGFNPFTLPREQWQHRRVLWRFHERRYGVWFGEGDPAHADTLSLCVRMPWGQAKPAAGINTLIPGRIQISDDLIELAALARLRERPLGPEAAKRLAQRIEAHSQAFQAKVRNAWLEATIVTPEGRKELAPRLAENATAESWLEDLALWVLRRTYPAFERFAPGHGPLPREAWIRFVRSATEGDLGAYEADEYVKLIREAYLLPMGLMRRRGRDYVVPTNLEKNELVSLVTPLLEHSPQPKLVYAHLANPIYGLVADQVTALLLFLLLQGEIDILKERASYRESFETLPNPLNYDRIVAGQTLDPEHTRALEQLCAGLNIRVAKHWTVLAQRRSATQLQELGRRRTEQLRPLIAQLQPVEQAQVLLQRVQRHIDSWNALAHADDPLQGFQQFLYTAGSVTAFLEEVNAFGGLETRIQRALGEIRRYRHLLQHPGLAVGDDSGSLAGALVRLGDMPGLEQLDELDAWLQQIARIYEAYKRDYRDRHDRWWAVQARHPIWEWRCPPLANSRHLGLDETLTAIEECRKEARQLRCRGLVNLDYQPLCPCGFDGEGTPIAATLERFEALRDEVATGLCAFFEQDTVKQRVREWQRDGFETGPETVSYLEGKCPVPEVRDVALLDKHLAGLELVKEVDESVFLELLRQRVWEPVELVGAVDRLLEGMQGRRLRFRPAAGSDVIPGEVIRWCGEQALRHGIALPKGLDRGALRLIGEQLRPEYVGVLGLQKLDELGLDEAGTDQIVLWLLDGQLALPEAKAGADSLLRAVQELLRPSVTQSPGELAELSALLYRHHARLQRLAGPRWRERLNAVATVELSGLPPLTAVLQENADAQWLMVDCLGLPLIRHLQSTIEQTFSGWKLPSLGFAEVSSDTTTDGFYRQLVTAGIQHPFQKLGVVDDLIHDGFAPLADLAALAATQLQLAGKTMLSKLDPGRPLLIFADHGFRIARDGRAYQHGGDSTLERVVPAWSLATYGSSEPA